MPDIVNIEVEKAVWQNQVVSFRRDYLIVKFVDVIDTDDDYKSLLDDFLVNPGFVSHYQLVNRIGSWGYVIVPTGTDIPHVAAAMSQFVEVAFAEPDLILRLCGRPSDEYIDPPPPDDPDRYHQWTVDYLNMPEAWDIETGNDSVVIGILDTGIPMDLEYSPLPGLGQPLGGCLNHDDLDGSRFIAGNNYRVYPVAPEPYDDHGHGTAMAGIAAAKDNNGKMVGMNWESEVYVCRVADNNGIAAQAEICDAIEEIVNYAGGRNVVINMSLQYAVDDAFEVADMKIGTLEEYSDKLVQNGGVLVCAAGFGEKKLMTFPAAASYKYPGNIIPVGAIEECGGMYSHSRRGGEVTLDDGSKLDLEIAVVAPGVKIVVTDLLNSYDVRDGTSEAAPHVAGLVSLMWCRNPGLTPAQVVQCLKNTSSIPDAIRDSWNESDWGGPLELWYGAGIINPVEALNAVDWAVTQVTSLIRFEDVPAGEEPAERIVLDVASCADVSFTVTVWGHDFGIAPGVYTHHPSDGSTFQELVATYRSDLPDDAESVVTIAWDQEPGVAFSVRISANRVAARRSAVILSVDSSGSMGDPSGIEAYSRLDVLKYSAGIVVDLTAEKSAIGVVSFDDVSHDVSAVTVIGPNSPGPIRNQLKADIDGLYAGGTTSIGAGLERSIELLEGIPEGLVEGDESKAILVLTDGKENTPPFVSDVMATDIPFPVYAIAMGKPETLGLDSMVPLTETTDGYTAVTGALDDESEYDIAKFYDQMLAEVNGDSVALDPTGRLSYRTAQEFLVPVARPDKRDPQGQLQAVATHPRPFPGGQNREFFSDFGCRSQSRRWRGSSNRWKAPDATSRRFAGTACAIVSKCACAPICA